MIQHSLKHRSLKHRSLAGLIALSALLLVSGCSTTAAGSGAAAPTPTTDALSGNLTIFAAASLTAAFNELAAEFTAENPAVTITPIVYDGSSTLATQLKEGASADVFASADEQTMADVAAAGLITGTSSIFATNTLHIAVQPGNPRGITSLADLARTDLLVVLCAPEVPCGAASQKLLGLQGVAVTAVSEEQNVKAVLTKVSTGEADAGLVYTTDVKAAAGSVDGVAIDGADRAINRYAIGVPSSAQNPAVAETFVSWVLSAPAQAILARFGFGHP
ncbi:molybdate ABC transporter substrate-binding protein [Leifsonia kafniensis]|uniref:Molybdate ABC transporter substrate-binding protein n=1 Tax=Leifsonia kafniensis TaxID=475957 RepID=A0ABP7K9M6_9MICO